MKILILPSEKYQPYSTDKPIEGMYYILESAEKSTDKQRQTAHALINEYWKTGLHPKYGGDQYNLFRDKLKRDLGAGFDSYVYADVIDGKPKIIKVKREADIPEEIRNGTDRESRILGRLKSMSDYTKRDYMQLIDNLIDDMIAAGVNTAKFWEILDGFKKKEDGKWNLI